MSAIVAGPAPGTIPRPDNVDEKQWKNLLSLLTKEKIRQLTEMTSEQLDQATRQAELNIREQEAAMASDEELAAAKARVKELKEPYDTAIKEQRALQRIASYLQGD